MEREQEINTAPRGAASINFQHPPPALALDREAADELRALLGSIMGTAGTEAASEDALDRCGRYAARALDLITQQADTDGRNREAEND